MNTHDKIDLPPLPEWSKMDNLGGLVPSEIRQALTVYARAAIEADRKRRGEPVADGWKLVPEEPTMEMLYAARKADKEYQARMGLPDTIGVGAYDHYVAM